MKRHIEVQAYLNVCNTKPAVFRDVINVAEYDPLRCASENIRVSSKDVRDACKVSAHKAAAEASVVRPKTHAETHLISGDRV